MKLYHYTSIETLALILKNGTIKFNRLDTVDDLEEAGYTSDGMQLGKYMFVSCWTKSSEENIALWSMYADKGKGIRIELDEDMFREYKAQDTQYVKVAKQEENILIPLSEIIRDDCMFFIPTKNNKYLFQRDIIYVDHPNEKVKDAFTRNNDGYNINFSLIGKYKRTYWKFQEETRFSLVAIPCDKNTSINGSPQIFYNIKKNIELPFKEYYLKLKPEVLDNIMVRLGPSCTEADNIIIEALLNEYTSNGKAVKSKLDGVIKMK